MGTYDQICCTAVVNEEKDAATQSPLVGFWTSNATYTGKMDGIYQQYEIRTTKDNSLVVGFVGHKATGHITLNKDNSIVIEHDGTQRIIQIGKYNAEKRKITLESETIVENNEKPVESKTIVLQNGKYKIS